MSKYKTEVLNQSVFRKSFKNCIHLSNQNLIIFYFLKLTLKDFKTSVKVLKLTFGGNQINPVMKYEFFQAIHTWIIWKTRKFQK